MSNYAECRWEAKETKNQQGASWKSLVDVSDFQGMVNLLENRRKKSRENGIGNIFEDFAAKGSWEVGQLEGKVESKVVFW